MSTLDFLFVGAYFLVVFLIGVWSSKKSLKNSRSYFLGGGGIGWMAIGASLFATNISAEHFIGLAGTGSNSGLAVGQFEWLACLILLFLGWFFAPFYLRTGVFTMPEFLERRYNPFCRSYLSAVSLVAYVFTKVSVAVYAGALVLQTILGWDMWTGAIVLIVVTGVYTIFGGLRAVIYTDFFQAGVLIGGGILLTATAVAKVGGFGAMAAHLDPSFFSVWKSASDPEFPWTGILFGAPILGIWYWCTDQVIVQRTLASKNIEEARAASIFAGYLKIIPVFILVLPGLAGRILFPGVVPDKMYATLVNNLLPHGAKGIVIAALLAALMSSLSSIFNSSSTLVVMDFYKKWRPNAPEKELVRAGQISTVVLVMIALVWLPFIGLMSGQIYVYLQSVQAYVSPPIAAVFLIGLLWKRASGTGAVVALLSGFVLGAARFIMEIGMKVGWLTWKPLVFYASVNFLHFAVFLFLVSSALLVLFSYLSSPPSEKNLFVFSGSGDPVSRGSAVTQRNNIIFSAVLILIVLVLWLIFSPIFLK